LGSIPKREEPGKTGAPCVKVPGSSQVPVRDGQTHAHRPRLVVSHSTCPPLSSSPHAHSFVIGPAVIKHTHTINTHTAVINTHPNSFVIGTPWVGSRSPDGRDQIPRWAGGWGLHQPPWSFGLDSQTRGIGMACAQSVSLCGALTTARRHVAALRRPPPLHMAYDDHDRNVSHIHGFT